MNSYVSNYLSFCAGIVFCIAVRRILRRIRSKEYRKEVTPEIPGN